VRGGPSDKRYEVRNAFGTPGAYTALMKSQRAWWIFFVLGVLTVISAPIGLLGNPPDPPSPKGFTGLTSEEIAARIPGMSDYISSIARQLGNFMLGFGLLLVAVAAVPFRKGERWAWYAMWAAPLVILIQLLNSRGGNGWQFDLGFVIITSAGLIWPYRRFFPKGPRT
jgi:hypothetical protein